MSDRVSHVLEKQLNYKYFKKTMHELLFTVIFKSINYAIPNEFFWQNSFS